MTKQEKRAETIMFGPIGRVLINSCKIVFGRKKPDDEIPPVNPKSPVSDKS